MSLAISWKLGVLGLQFRRICSEEYSTIYRKTSVMEFCVINVKGLQIKLYYKKRPITVAFLWFMLWRFSYHLYDRVFTSDWSWKLILIPCENVIPVLDRFHYMEAAVRRFCTKKCVLKNFLRFSGKHRVGVSSLISLQACSSFESCEIFKHTCLQNTSERLLLTV